MVRAMNSAALAVTFTEEKKLLDIVGTGGDGADTINISTASVVLAAACGATVAKAGNRSVSSCCGSADVLEALGVQVDLSPTQVVECVEKCGIAFLFAPINHPAMKAVAPIRKQLGVRTCFNILGPMTNAASAQRAVIGVFDEDLLMLMAETLKEVGRVDHAVVIHGSGLDEISPLGPASIVEVRAKKICVLSGCSNRSDLLTNSSFFQYLLRKLMHSFSINLLRSRILHLRESLEHTPQKLTNSIHFPSTSHVAHPRTCVVAILPKMPKNSKWYWPVENIQLTPRRIQLF